jgi:hypothetical protein
VRRTLHVEKLLDRRHRRETRLHDGVHIAGCGVRRHVRARAPPQCRDDRLLPPCARLEPPLRRASISNEAVTNADQRLQSAVIDAAAARAVFVDAAPAVIGEMYAGAVRPPPQHKPAARVRLGVETFEVLRRLLSRGDRDDGMPATRST